MIRVTKKDITLFIILALIVTGGIVADNTNGVSYTSITLWTSSCIMIIKELFQGGNDNA